EHARQPVAHRLTRVFAHRREGARRRIDAVQARLLRECRAPLPQAARVAHVARALATAGRDHVRRAERHVDRLGAALALLNPTAVLDRGYAIVTAADGAIIADA